MNTVKFTKGELMALSFIFSTTIVAFVFSVMTTFA